MIAWPGISGQLEMVSHVWAGSNSGLGTRADVDCLQLSRAYLVGQDAGIPGSGSLYQYVGQSNNPWDESTSADP